jgi:hypothetical protein
MGDDAIWIRGVNPDGSSDVYGLVPDGVDSVRAGAVSATPANNAFVLRGVAASDNDLVIDGPAVHRDISIGPLDGTAANTAPSTITVP